MLAIKINKLSKYYGQTLGIKDLSFEVPKGKIFGFLGANGAGKTTTIRILLGLIKATEGSVEILGTKINKESKYPEELHNKIGFLPGELRLYEDMTGQAFLNYMGEFYTSINQDLQQEALNTLDLSKEQLLRKISQYSRGMKQKIGIVQAIQHDPELIIMDEPTEGLDPLIQQKFYSLFKKLQNEGKTIFLSSHNMNEVERICQKIAIIRQGKLVTIENINELKNKRLYSFELSLETEEEVESFKIDDLQEIKKEKNNIKFRWKGEFPKLFSELSQYNVQEFHCQKASLEEIFLTYYNDQEDDSDE